MPVDLTPFYAHVGITKEVFDVLRGSLENPDAEAVFARALKDAEMGVQPLAIFVYTLFAFSGRDLPSIRPRSAALIGAGVGQALDKDNADRAWADGDDFKRIGAMTGMGRSCIRITTDEAVAWYKNITPPTRVR